MDKPRSRCLADLQRCFAPRYVGDDMITSATSFSHAYHGSADQVARVRRDCQDYLAGCLIPDGATDDAVLIASELATNAILHSHSADAFLIVRVETRSSYVWLEVEDLGGPWHPRGPDGRPHGVDIITALVGPDGWGSESTSDGGRVTWARVDLGGRT